MDVAWEASRQQREARPVPLVSPIAGTPMALDNGGTDGRHYQAMHAPPRCDITEDGTAETVGALLWGVQIGRGTETRSHPCPLRLDQPSRQGGGVP